MDTFVSNRVDCFGLQLGTSLILGTSGAKKPAICVVLVGAVGIEPSSPLQTRKLFILRPDKNYKNDRNAEARYTAGTRNIMGTLLNQPSRSLPAIQRSRNLAQKSENVSGAVASTTWYLATNSRHNWARNWIFSGVAFTRSSIL